MNQTTSRQRRRGSEANNKKSRQYVRPTVQSDMDVGVVRNTGATVVLPCWCDNTKIKYYHISGDQEILYRVRALLIVVWMGLIQTVWSSRLNCHHHRIPLNNVLLAWRQLALTSRTEIVGDKPCYAGVVLYLYVFVLYLYFFKVLFLFWRFSVACRFMCLLTSDDGILYC